MKSVTSTVLSAENDSFGQGADELGDECNVILVSAPVVATVRVEEVVASQQFEGHARRRPNICRAIVTSPDKHFQRAILKPIIK